MSFGMKVSLAMIKSQSSFRKISAIVDSMIKMKSVSVTVEKAPMIDVSKFAGSSAILSQTSAITPVSALCVTNNIYSVRFRVFKI